MSDPAAPSTQGSHPGFVAVQPEAKPSGVEVRTAMGSVLIAIAILTLMDAGIKHLSATYGTPQILLMRYVSGTLVAGLIVAALIVLRRMTTPSRGSIKRALQRSFLIIAVAGCFFYSLSVIPLAEATAIAFTAPIYLALLGWVVLKEPVAKQTWLAIVVGLVGVVVISSGAFQEGQAFSGALSGYITAAMASVFYAGALVLTRLHAASDPVPTMIMLQSGFSALLALPFVLLTAAGLAIDGRAYVAFDNEALLFALGIGVLGTIGHFFMAWGFKHAEAAKLGPMEYTSLLWAAIYGLVLFGEVPGWRLYVGCGFIVAGTWLVMRAEKKAG